MLLIFLRQNRYDSAFAHSLSVRTR